MCGHASNFSDDRCCMDSLSGGLLSGGGCGSGRCIGGVACGVGEATCNLWQATCNSACSQNLQRSWATSASGSELHPQVHMRPCPLLPFVCINLWRQAATVKMRFVGLFGAAARQAGAMAHKLL